MSIKSIIIVALLILVSLFMASCVTDGNKATSTNTSESKTTPAKKEATGELAEKLYQNFHSDPVLQWQKDENDLIDYAIDKGLDVTRTESGLYYIIHKKKLVNLTLLQ